MRMGLISRAVVTALVSFTFVGCGSSSSAPDVQVTPAPIPANDQLTLTVRMPMQVQHAHLTVSVVGESKPLYDNADFSAFDAQIGNIALSDYRDKIVVVSLTPNANSTIYDPIADRLVAFTSGSLHAISTIKTQTPFLNLSPLSEAIYQRTLVRAGNVDVRQSPDLSLIEAKHITKATDEVGKALNYAFHINQMPRFSSTVSNWQNNGGSNTNSDYINLFMGLGTLQVFVNLYPQTINSYVTAAQSLGIDLRDGSLDGRSIVGDNSVFQPLIQPAAPYNVDVVKNNFIDIGKTQQSTRENFGKALKTATLDYAYKHSQNLVNPQLYALLQTTKYFDTASTTNSTDMLRYVGAGDYRRAFGLADDFNSVCGAESTYPCKQGLNADDIQSSISDIEYLIGQHSVGDCKVNIMPSGQVSVLQGTQQYNAALDRDASDNLQRIGRGHYLLNIGNSTLTPIAFTQLDIQDRSIIAVKIGTANTPYPVNLTQTITSCSAR